MRKLSDTITSTHVKNTLVVTLPAEFSATAVEQLHEVALEHVHEHRMKAVVFDCSALHYMDRQEFDQLRAALSVLAMLGAQPCLVGLRPGIIKYLILANVDNSGIQAFLDLNEALDHFSSMTEMGVNDEP